MRLSALATLFLTVSAGFGIAAGDATAGKAAYDKSCKSCHGAEGAPNPGMAKAMKVDMKALSSSEVQGTSDADLKKIITDGKGKMKPVKSVAGKDIDNVIAYVRSLKK